MKPLLLYSPILVLLAWAFCVALGLTGRLATVGALVVLAASCCAHIREELRRVG